MGKRITYTADQARRIQRWGEQHPNFHNAEMKRWRKYWKEPQGTCERCGSYDHWTERCSSPVDKKDVPY